MKLTASTPEARDMARLKLARAGFAMGRDGGMFLQTRIACKQCGKRFPRSRRKYCSDRCGAKCRATRNRLHRSKYAMRDELGLAPASETIRQRHLAMIALRASGATYCEIGEKFGCRIGQAFFVCNQSATARKAPRLVRVAVMLEPEEFDEWKRAAGSKPLPDYVREIVRAKL